MWIVWTGGNDRFWDADLGQQPRLASTCSRRSRRIPTLGYGRAQPLEVSRPRQRAVLQGSDRARPEPLRALARRPRSGLPARSVRRTQTKYPGVKIGARGKTVPVGSYYGEPTGIVGLRLFPEPGLRREGAQALGRRAVLQRPELLLDRAIWCGRTASACRAGSATSARIRSSRPPIPRTRSGRTSAPTSARSTSGGIASSTGRATRTRSSFLYQALHTSRPGHARHVARLDRQHQQPADDERGLLPRAAHGRWRSAGARRRWPAAGWTTSSSTTSCRPGDPLAQFFEPPSTTWTPRVLKDGSDSVGALGALNRVYLNIGLFSEEWLLHFRPLIGGRPITPIRSPTRRRTRSTGRRPSSRRRTWRASSSQAPIRTT